MKNNFIGATEDDSVTTSHSDVTEFSPVTPQLVSPQPAEGTEEDTAPTITGEKQVCFCWQLICPPNNWQQPIPIEPSEVRLLDLLSQRLNLVLTKDLKRRKLYLGNALAAPQEVNQGLRFPNGWMAHVVPDDEAEVDYEAVDSERTAPLIPAFPDAQVSKNFRLSEFRPGDHTYDLIRLSPTLVNILEEIRRRAGDQPLHITSGYRPKDYNRSVGGISNSTHIDGIAADFYADHLSTADLHQIAEDVIGDQGGVGYYPSQGFVHIDLRGYPARWP